MIVMSRLYLSLTIALSVCACNPSDDARRRGERELVVFAAASLTDAMTAIEKDFEAQHERLEVTVSFAGSHSLRTQIENGAKPHVFASANAKHLERLRASDLVSEPMFFVENELVIVVPHDNPAGIHSLRDLVKAERLVLAGADVPAGAYAEQLLANADATLGGDFHKGVMAKVVSRENHVRQTLQKVVLGEADAALVYATDARSAGDKVVTITIPREQNIVAAYPIATVDGAPHPRLGTKFVDFVRSDAAGLRFKEFGFRPVASP